MTSEDLQLHVFDRTLDLVCFVNKEGWFQQVNPSVMNTLGYTKEELFSQPVAALIHPDDRKRTANVRSKLLSNEPLVNFQNRYLAKNGSIVWLQWTSVYIPEREIVFAIAKNITATKNIEFETEQNFRKYKELTQHFKDLVEKDKQYFAEELHEELGQLATVIKMDMEWVHSLSILPDEAAQKRLRQATATVQLLIDKIRKLSYSINPAQVDELGLHIVLRSMCREFAAHCGIKCSYEGAFDENALSREIKLDLLRICQEALANVRKHAQATKVSLRLIQKKKKIELCVRDNGKGFEQESKQTFGFKNMHRRAASINGELVIKSRKRKGTTVTVTVVNQKSSHT